MSFLKSRTLETLTRFIPVAALLCAAALPGLGQVVSGDITGTVYDATGAVIPNATVVATNDATGVATSTKSTTAGVYRLSNLPVGTYTLNVTANGFTKSQIRNVSVQLNVVATSNVTLQVGQTTEHVDVSAAAAMVDTTSANVSGDFNARAVMQLPTASTGSGVLNLSLLSAGVASSGAVGVGSGPSVGGQRPRNNNFMVEGVDNNSGSVTGPLVSVPNDAVAEFSVQQNMFSPEFGHSSGGQFNEVIKSGTNNFHGSAYEYLENRNLMAADNLSAVDQVPLHSRYDNNRFGGEFGGPIKKNKLFFYGLYEYNPIGYAGSAGMLFAPTAAGWNTIQSFASMPGFNQTSMNELKKYLGTAPTAAAPASTPNKAYPLVGPGNLSLNEQDPATTKAVEIGQIGITAPSYTNNESGVASIDYNPNEKDAMRGRFVLNRSGFIDTAASLPTFYTTVPNNNYLVTFSEFHTFSPTLINEFRLGFNRNSNTYPAGNFTWPGLDEFPNVQVYDISAQIGPDPNAPQFGYQNQYQLTDNVTWTKGDHSLKVGFDGYRQISPQGFTQRQRGDYEWSNLSDYLFDYNPDYIAQRSLGNATYWGNRWFTGMFVNDTWKIRNNLTINLGLRYEYTTVPASEELQSMNAISNVPGLITFQSPTAQTNAWMPRIGIAWSPGTSGRTSIRAGFGRSYDVLFDNLGLLALPPQMISTVDVTGLDQGGFLANGGIRPTAPGDTLSQADARSYTGGWIPNQVRPESLQWNIGIQHVFHNDYTFESRYVGTRGLFLPVQIQMNRMPELNASNALPVYFSAPSQATLNGLTNTLGALTSAYPDASYKPAYLNAGFDGIITSFLPWGASTYHGWANQLTRRFSNGMQFLVAYTYSHDIDNSTAEVFSTFVTPRRPQDATNLNADRSSSALDHRQRLTASMVFESQWYKASNNWFLKNVVGNWEFAPIYTYQTGTLWDVQSGVDSNINGDSAGDRAILNPGGTIATGTGTTPLKNSNGDTVAYLVKNPNAMYVSTPRGAIANVGRNTEHLNPINDVDMTFTKRIAITERYHLELAGRFLNIFNHPQYTGGYLNDIAPIGATSSAQHNFLIPASSIFADPSMAFSSNPRSIQVSAKFTF